MNNIILPSTSIMVTEACTLKLQTLFSVCAILSEAYADELTGSKNDF